MILWFATNNKHKKDELQSCINKYLQDIIVKIPSDEDIVFDPQETGSDFCENSLLKARELHTLLFKKRNICDPVLADDSGLCVDALDGKPGVLSARYGFTDGKKIESGRQNLMLLDELGDNPNRSARFVCAMTFLYSFSRFIIAQETIEGEIVTKDKIKGEGGFGYDPIFYVPQKKVTLAEISTEEKNKISHRGKAVKIICKHLCQCKK